MLAQQPIATRKLAAIMAIDVVGYSRLMGEDETGTAQAVREHREAARPLVITYGGRIFKTMGDGLLLEFPSVVAAVKCAIAIQELMIERGKDVPEEKQIIYRIGVNLCDVLIDGDDILGDGVNITARLEAICEPGSLMISAAAHDHVQGKIDVEFIDQGEQELKNITRPVRAYAVRIGSRRWKVATPSPTRAIFAPPRLSLLVLPFANLGGADTQDYFVDGVTESVTTELSRIRGSFVIARHTAFAYKGKSIDIRQIGRELNVRYVLEGSVRRAFERLRVAVQLIDVEPGNHVWADRFDKPVTDLFDMQDEIASRVANALDAQLVAAEARRAERLPNPDSMDLYFQGMAWYNRGGTRDSFARASAFYEQALEADPGNVDALAAKGYIDALVGVSLYSEDRAARFAAAEAALMNALAQSPDHAFAHLALGATLTYTNRGLEGIASCERALILNRNLAGAHFHIGAAKYLVGRAAETEAHVREALRLSPIGPHLFSWLANVGIAKLYLGKDEEALDWFRQSIEANRNYMQSYLFRSAAAAHLGRLDEARASMRAAIGLVPDLSVKRLTANPVSDNPTYLAQRERAVRGWRLAGLREE